MTNPLEQTHMVFSRTYSPTVVAERFREIYGHYPEHILYPPTHLPSGDVVGVVVATDEHAKLFAYAGPVR